MERVELRTKTRTLHGKQVKQLRMQEWIPAVVYGHDTASRPLLAPERALIKALKRAGSTALINLYVDEEETPIVVLSREIQHNPITGRLLHVDFYQVRLTEKVKTSPRLRFHGEPQAIKGGLAVLLHNLTEIEIECLPTDLINYIDVDVSGLENIGDSIYVRDLAVPPSITILEDANEPVASLVPTRMAIKEEEEVAVVPEAAVEAEAEAEEEDKD